MKAMVNTEYGSPDVLQLREIEKPEPRDDEELVKVYASSVNAADWHYLGGQPLVFRLAYGLLEPKIKILGADVAGRVEAVGKDVKKFRLGDEVFGDLAGVGFGAFAEYVRVPEKVLDMKPTNLSFEEAAAVPVAAVTALQGLHDKGRIHPGQKVLINGASGGVGTFAVQIAKSFGTEVTAVTSTRNLGAARHLGADHVIDYTREDFTKNGQRYDLILAANGYHPISAYKRALRPGGIYIVTGGSTAQMFEAMLLGPWMFRTESKKQGNLAANPNIKDLAFVKELLEMGNVRPVIDRCYPFNEIPDAFRYLEEGHARGKIVISLHQTN